jgi:hypothetical protein
MDLRHTDSHRQKNKNTFTDVRRFVLKFANLTLLARLLRKIVRVHRMASADCFSSLRGGKGPGKEPGKELGPEPFAPETPLGTARW